MCIYNLRWWHLALFKFSYLPKFQNAPTDPPKSEMAAIKRFGLGVLYLTIFQILGLLVSDDYLLTDDFRNLNFFKKMFLLGIWGRYTLYKYISCWLLAEGACILFGRFIEGMINIHYINSMCKLASILHSFYKTL